jgi:hypothetical protein
VRDGRSPLRRSAGGQLQLAAIPLLLEAGARLETVRMMLSDVRVAVNVGPELAPLVARAEAELAKHAAAEPAGGD